MRMIPILQKKKSRVIIMVFFHNVTPQIEGTAKAEYDEATRTHAPRNNHVLPCEASRPPKWKRVGPTDSQ